MTNLDLAPAIAAIRSRPEEFELSHGSLHHRPSSHRFHFLSDEEVSIHALCDCSLLRTSPEQAKIFHAAYREWRAGYWRSVEINREFSSHFTAPPLWRRLAIRFLERLLSAALSGRSYRNEARPKEHAATA